VICNFNFNNNSYYSIRYSNEDQGYYYDYSGKLQGVDFDVGDSYPVKTYKHSYPSGKILSLSVYVSENECYVFSPDGALLSHWIGMNCYDIKGNIISTREEITE